MAETTQFTFSIVETIDALIRKQGIHDGKWTIAFEIGVNIGNLQTAPDDGRPGAMLIINNVQLTKAVDGLPPTLVVDAAVANPKV